ncbi:hypothetical protein COCVIDRAFT_28017 [Bipolaris victoriae FI3]|uniref:Uncharacterized protein n=1 Tax=Bipolaris victoriae (strain FI3) TaxID=930091 RepID=W7EB52_BIPV3|nr:hypothetical protein COCVIDRAFT_28017 [Bipolaris victoriae FI3]
MRLSLFLSASAAFLLATATSNEGSLSEAIKGLAKGNGVQVLGYDGVLRSLNLERTKVIDYIQLDKDQVAEYVKTRLDESVREHFTGVDGTTVISKEQLLAVPDFIQPYVPKPQTSKPGKEVSPLLEKRACNDHACDGNEDCWELNCDDCVWRSQYCGGGSWGCINYYRCSEIY